MILAVTAQPNSAFPYGCSYYRSSAKLNGEMIWVDARTKQECRTHKAALKRLARRHGLTMMKVHNLLYSLSLSDFDTAPFDPDAPEFVFSRFPIGEPPDPEDNVDAIKAWAAYKRDAELCAKLLRGDPTVFQLLAISRNQRAWAEYFSIRYADPSVRSLLRQAIAEHDVLRAEAAEKAQRQLARKQANGQQH
jgi:hypothetical protein